MIFSSTGTRNGLVGILPFPLGTSHEHFISSWGGDWRTTEGDEGGTYLLGVVESCRSRLGPRMLGCKERLPCDDARRRD